MPRTVVSRDDPMNSSDEVPDDSNTAGVSSTNEQSKVPVINVTESEIDAIDDIMTALEKCEQHRVVFNDFEHQDVSSLRLLLKCSLLCKGTSRADIEDTLNKRQHFERPRMDNLCAVYKEALQLITENDKLFCYTLHIEAFQSIADNHNNYNAESLTFNKNIITDFNKYIYKLQNYRSPILVLGETGAGKTSFINLLLGERLLPSSLLSNTHTICELGYSHTENIEAEIEYAGHPTGSSVKKQCFSVKQNNFVHFIKAEVESTNVQKITLQGPFNILKNDVVIVDSPGVGESPEMNDVILGYVEKAAAFVFVIDMMNAGGVQQRTQEFIENVKKLAKGIQGFDVQNVMFVCNKLDEVPSQEKEMVIEDTVKRLQILWNGLDKSQIIPFSTKEAQWIQDQGAVSPNFRKVLDRLADLIPAAQCMATLQAKMWLENILEGSLHITHTLEKKSLDKQNTEHRLKDLENNRHLIMSQLRESLATRIQTEAAEMSERVKSERSKGIICRFDESTLPIDETWHDAAANIRAQLFERILEAVNLQKIADNIEVQIQSELKSKMPSFQSSLNALRVSLSGRPKTVIKENTTHFLPEYVHKVYGKSIGMTVLLTTVIPFIALGRLPVFLFKRIQESREMSAMERKYLTANGNIQQIRETCEQYAHNSFQHIVKQMKIKTLAAETMQVFYGRLDELENEMEQTIGSYRQFIESFPRIYRDIQSGLVNIKEIGDKLACLKTRTSKCLHDG